MLDLALLFFFVCRGVDSQALQLPQITDDLTWKQQDFRKPETESITYDLKLLVKHGVISPHLFFTLLNFGSDKENAAQHGEK